MEADEISYEALQQLSLDLVTEARAEMNCLFKFLRATIWAQKSDTRERRINILSC
jgi:hypothetical protein